MDEQKTVGDIVNRLRAATDLDSALAVFIDEEEQGVTGKQLEVILKSMLEWDDHEKKNLDAGLASTAVWALNAAQRQVIENLRAVIFRARLQPRLK
jgi:hypothetical protein